MSKLGSALNSGQGIELGSMSNSTRNNAGVSTAVGTLIYNSDTEAVECYGNDGWIKVKTLRLAFLLLVDQKVIQIDLTT